MKEHMHDAVQNIQLNKHNYYTRPYYYAYLCLFHSLYLISLSSI